jgi:hypothetical protein
MILTVLSLIACNEKDSTSKSSVGSAAATGSPTGEQTGSASTTTGSAAIGSAAAPTGSAAVGSAAGGSAAAVTAGSTTAAQSESDEADEVAQLVVRDVGSPALGKQKIEASCVAVNLLPAGDWTVAAARLNDCGDKTARSILWLYKRADKGKWSEDYVGQPPRCWKGVPADIAVAVSKLTKIPSC